MIIIFSSSDDFAILHHCLEPKIKTVLLVTESPKPKGRGLKIQPNPAHKYATKHNIPVLSPAKLNSDSIDKIKKVIAKNNTTIGLVSAYGKLIPQRVIDLFKFGIINIHPSLLPKYRGPAPISTAILNRDKESGYTIINIDKGCDTGDIITQQKIQVEPSDYYNDLKNNIFSRLCKDLPTIIEDVLSGKSIPSKQNHKLAIYTKKTVKSDAQILDSDTLDQALGKILAYAQWPKAYMILNNKRVVIHKAHITNNKLVIDLLQLEGKKPVPFSDFKNGYTKLLTQMPDFVKI